jgi:hypothetical protein
MLALTACGGGPREKVMPSDKAQQDRRAMRVKVIAAYQNDHMDYTNEPRVGWVVDVDVLAGPEYLIGESLTLPYDDFALGKPPPADGTELTITPADWMNPPGSVRYKVRDRDRERERR